MKPLKLCIRLRLRKHLAVHFEEIEAVDIQGERGLLTRVVTNLMLNAIQYTPDGGEISFALYHDAGHAVFTVADTGIGIPEDVLPAIFDRFYRVEQSRSHDTGGSGLGLSIVQKIVEIHHGTISVSSIRRERHNIPGQFALPIILPITTRIKNTQEFWGLW